MNATGVVGWAPEPQGRGTIGLVWSCLVTIFLCTWNAVHPNLPAENDKARHILWRRLKYLFFALTAPEWFCSLAAQDFFNARFVQKKIRPITSYSTNKLSVAKFPGWSLAKCHYINMGGFAVKVNDESKSLPPGTLLKLLSTNVLSWPETTDAEISDRSKADWVLKSLALVQAVWFVLQVIGRADQHLSVTTLELFTLGIISCAFITYAAWWAKPFDVRKPTILKPKRSLPATMEFNSRIGFTPSVSSSDIQLPLMLGICAALILGALHVVAWRFYFPSEIERWLWRGSSLACVALPLMIWTTMLFEESIGEDWKLLLGRVCGGLYIFCRLYMMMEMFASLRKVPADVYKTPQWSQYFPSFS